MRTIKTPAFYKKGTPNPEGGPATSERGPSNPVDVLRKYPYRVQPNYNFRMIDIILPNLPPQILVLKIEFQDFSMIATQ